MSDELSGAAIIGFYGAIKICLRDGYDPEDVFRIVLAEFLKGDIR